MNTAMNGSASDKPHDFDFKTASESSVLQHLLDEQESEMQSYQNFSAYLEDIDEYVCTRGELIQAIRTAPTPSMRVMLFTIYRFREHIALITGRSFI